MSSSGEVDLSEALGLLLTISPPANVEESININRDQEKIEKKADMIKNYKFLTADEIYNKLQSIEENSQAKKKEKDKLSILKSQLQIRNQVLGQKRVTFSCQGKTLNSIELTEKLNALDQEPLNQQQSLIKEALRDPKKLIGKHYIEDVINVDGQRITLEKTVGPTDNFNLFLAKFSEQKINLKISTFLCASYSRPYERCSGTQGHLR